MSEYEREFLEVLRGIHNELKDIGCALWFVLPMIAGIVIAILAAK